MKIILPRFFLFALPFLLFGCGPTSLPSATLPKPSSTLLSLRPTLTQTPTITLMPTEVPPTPIWDVHGLIAYQKYTIDAENYKVDQAIYISDAEGQKRINVFDGLTGHSVIKSWSPSGDWLLFVQYEALSEPLVTPTKDPRDTGMEQPSNLWAARADGSERHQIMTVNLRQQIVWAQNQDIFLIECEGIEQESELCMVDPASGKITRTGKIGANQQFSPDSKSYAYIMDGTKIYLVDIVSQTSQLLFSPSFGKIVGFAWRKDKKTIIAAVMQQAGCGNNLDGASSIIEIDLQTKNVKTLKELKWSIYSLNLSPDEKYILSHWWLCTGNGYDLNGIIGLEDDYIEWPLQRFSHYKWDADSNLVSVDFATSVHYRMNLKNPNLSGEMAAPFFDALISQEEREHGVGISWISQPDQ